MLQNTSTGNAPIIPKEICKAIWRSKGILPKTRVFLWKAAHEALPVDHILSSRLNKPPTGCSICGAAIESVSHVLFKCPKAQQIWLASHFGLRTDNLLDSMKELLTSLLNQLEGQQLGNFLTILWHTWKDRCKECFEGKKLRAQQTLAAAASTMSNLQTADKLFSRITVQMEDPLVKTRYRCWIDASWVHAVERGAGLAFVLFDNDQLMEYWIAPAVAATPFHAELLALKNAIHRAIILHITDCTFKTDCLQLKQVLNGETNVSEVDWQAFHDATYTILIWDDMKQSSNLVLYSCKQGS
ncbi:Ribonuclease H-like superfamily protein [Rhynchospora pubera]|uniref:Ribonuclease H-like superfamily protein n=1 Tax=Rhynchospora pubera TaxID=906938 RepID=A0AAV8GSG3_9POAL|nr:Ribonuclease H-like superfamily protein [Rhynchospora pubera]